MRIAVGIEYDGSRYHGWQKQIGLKTLQAQVELALSKVADEPIDVVCAGRTDSGVHATCQVIHFDTTAKRQEKAWVLGTNTFLPQDIRAYWVKTMPDDFHARFSAKARRYHYITFNALVRSALLHNYCSWYPQQLDIESMQTAAYDLIGEHDFTSYRASECQSKSPNRNVMELQVNKKANLILFDIKANAFLHHMVRNIVGVLLAIGSEKYPVSWAKEVLNAKDRRAGGVTAHPQGLYLVEVEYPKVYGLGELYVRPYHAY